MMLAIGVPPSAVHHGGTNFVALLVFIAVVAFIGWFLAQTRRSRQPVWERRFARLDAVWGPIARNVRADVRAVRQDIRVWRFRRGMK